MNHEPDPLDESLAELPQSIAPERDLWPGIRAGLDAQPTESSWRRPAALAIAAAIALVLVLGFLVRPDTLNPGVSSLAHSHPAQPTADELKKVRSELTGQIRGRLAALPDPTREVVARNLATIERALIEIDVALLEHPDAGLDATLLLTMYADQLTLLHTLNDLVTRPVQEFTL